MSSGPVNRLPLGLLSYLDLKGNGRYPDTFGNVIAPCLELMTFFAPTLCSEQISNRTTTHNVDVSGSQPFGVTGGGPIIVPPNEIWLVEFFDVLTAALNNSQFAAIPIYRPQPNGSNMDVSLIRGNCPRLDPTIAGGQFRIGADGPVLIPPGAELRYWIVRMNGAAVDPVTVDVAVKYKALRP